MTGLKTFGTLAVLVLAALGGRQLWTHRGDSAPAATRDAALATAPPLSLPDLSGRTVDLASLRGRAVVVNFWASWCPPCRFEIPELSAFYRENHDRCFEMLGVAEESGPRDQVASAAKSFGIAYPVLFDATGDAARRFGLSGLPHTVVIDPAGKVRTVFEGAIGRQQLDAALSPLLPPRGAPCPRA